MRNISLCDEHCENIYKCWEEFESISSGTLFDHATIKILSKKEQKVKAKLLITKGISNLNV